MKYHLKATKCLTVRMRCTLFFAARTVQAAVIFCFLWDSWTFTFTFFAMSCRCSKSITQQKFDQYRISSVGKVSQHAFVGRRSVKTQILSSWCTWVKIELPEITNWNAETVVCYFDLGWVFQQFRCWTLLLKRVAALGRAMDDDEALSYFSASGGGGAAGPNPMPPSIGGQVHGHYNSNIHHNSPIYNECQIQSA